MSASLPTAIPAYISILQAALPTGFQVKLGTIVGVYIAPQTLLISGVRFTQDAYAELGPTYRHEEQYVISNSLCSSSGGIDDEPTRLQEVYTLYKTIQTTIANNPNLNNTVRLAWPKQVSYSPTYDAIHGYSVGVLNFEVECQVRVTSLT